MTFRTLGGMMPDGSWVLFPGLPYYVEGGDYILFLRNTAWYMQPVHDTAAFRIADVDGRKIVVTPDGFAITGLDSNELFYTTEEQVFDATLDLAAPTAMPTLMATHDISAALDKEAFVSLLSTHLSSSGVMLTGPTFSTPTVPDGGWEAFPAEDPEPAPLPPEPPEGEEPRPIECIDEIPEGEDLCHD